MKRALIGWILMTALAGAACTTTYTEDELPAEGRKQAADANSEMEYDEGVARRGGENVQALEEEAEWNVEDEER